MKQRLLLLGGAVVLLGSVAFGGALSFEDFDSSASTGTTSVYTPDGPDIVLSPSTSTIAANGTYQQIANISANDTDGNYDYTLVSVAITNEALLPDPGTVLKSGTCGSFDYAVTVTGDNSNGASFAVPDEGVTDTGEDVFLSIAATGTDTDCQLSGAVVTATFVVQGDTGELP